MVARYNHWPFQDWAVFSLSLEGNALETIMLQISWGQYDYDSLLRTVQWRFNPAHSRHIHRSKLRRRTQRPRQSPEDYGVAMRHMFRKAYPEIPQKECEGLLIDKYLEGFEVTEGWRHASLKEPRTLDEAVTMMAQYEAVTREMGMTWKPPASRIHQVGDVKAAKPTTEPMTQLQKDIQILSREVRELKAAFARRQPAELIFVLLRGLLG